MAKNHKLQKVFLIDDDPRNLAYVPTAPSNASTLFDLVVSASSIMGANWETGAGAIALYHWTLIREREPKRCFKAFLHNNWFGAAVFAGLAPGFVQAQDGDVGGLVGVQILASGLAQRGRDAAHVEDVVHDLERQADVRCVGAERVHERVVCAAHHRAEAQRAGLEEAAARERGAAGGLAGRSGGLLGLARVLGLLQQLGVAEHILIQHPIGE